MLDVFNASLKAGLVQSSLRCADAVRSACGTASYERIYLNQAREQFAQLTTAMAAVDARLAELEAGK